MEPMLIVAAVAIGAIAAALTGTIARRAGFLWGAIIPGLMIGITLYAGSVKVHPEGGMGQGMLVLFVLLPLCVVTTLGWVVGLWLRIADKRRQASSP